jgi:valyl-tRNA synthetase
MQPFGDRSNVVIEPMLTDQWFVDTARIVGPAIDAVRDGPHQILPERDAKTYFHWLENIEPGASPASSGGATDSGVVRLDLHPALFADDQATTPSTRSRSWASSPADFVGEEPRHHCAWTRRVVPFARFMAACRASAP